MSPCHLIFLFLFFPRFLRIFRRNFGAFFLRTHMAAFQGSMIPDCGIGRAILPSQLMQADLHERIFAKWVTQLCPVDLPATHPPRCELAKAVSFTEGNWCMLLTLYCC